MAGVAVNIAIFDVTTHAWDLAKATGQSTDLDPEVIGVAYQVAQNMLSDDLRNAGLFGPGGRRRRRRRRPPTGWPALAGRATLNVACER